MGKLFGHRWYVVSILLTISMLGYVDRFVLSFLIDPIKESLSLSDTQVGLVGGAAFSLFYVIAGLPLGRLVDTRNRRRVLTVCIGLWSLATALCGAASNFITLFLARVGVGVGEAALNPSAISIIADIFPRDKVVLPVAIFTMGFPVGSGLAIMLGGQLADYFAGLGAITIAGFQNIDSWRLVFVAVGLPGILVALFFYFTVKEPKRHLVGAEDEAARQSIKGVIRLFSKNKKLYGLMLGGLVAHSFYQFSVLVWFPPMLMRTFELSPGEVGIPYGTVFLLFGFAGALAVAPVMRWLANRGYKEAPAIILLSVAILIIPFAAVAPLMPSFGWCLACFAVSMFCWSMSNTTAFTAFTLVTPNAMRGIIIAIYTMGMNLIGGTIASVFIGVLNDDVFGPENIRYSVALTAVVFLPICATLFAFLRPVYRRHAIAQAEALEAS